MMAPCGEVLRSTDALEELVDVTNSKWKYRSLWDNGVAEKLRAFCDDAISEPV
jgi:hypothetical protein